MRTKKPNRDYLSVSRASIKRDFEMVQINTNENKVAYIEKETKIDDEKRIIYISDRGEYAKFARYIVGKCVRVLERSDIGGSSYYCEFVHDIDRVNLNRAAGWSNNKMRFLFEGVKFK